MRWPILINKADLKPIAAMAPSSLGVSEVTEGLGTAQMTLTQDQAPTPVGSWVRIFTPHGDAGVHVVQSETRNAADGTRTIELEHAFGILAGEMIFGEVTPDTVTGVKDALKVGAEALIRYALAQQSVPVWQLGRCEFDTAQGWTFANATIMEILDTVTESLMDCAWEFDTSTLPFTANLVRWNKEPGCEMRMTRNISSMSITTDRSQMATRLYPIGNNGLTIGEVPYVEKNVGTWGLVAKTETDVTIEDADLLRAWGEARLDKLAQPMVSVDVSGLDLSAATGEPMDRLEIGRMCRVPLPEYGTTVLERINALTWQDLVADETSVQITMANSREGITNVVRQLKKAGGGGAKAAAKEDKKMWTEFVKTDERIGLEAYRIDGLQTAYAGIIVKADEITSRVGTIEGDILNIGTEIKQTKDTISLKADKVELEGLVTADELSVVNERVTHLTSGDTTASSLKTNLLSASTGFTYQGHSIAIYTVDVGGETYHLLGYK